MSLSVQVVAKKMEKMLETSLQQLKMEQKLRKESEAKCLSLQNKVETLEKQISHNEEVFGASLNEKDEKIVSLEATAEFLEKALIQKDEELGKKQDIIKKLRSRINLFSKGQESVALDTVNNFEKRLTELIEEGKSKGEDEGFPHRKSEGKPSQVTNAIEITPVERVSASEREASERRDICHQIKTEDKADHEINFEIVIEGSAETEESWDEPDDVIETDDPLESKPGDEESKIKIEPSEEAGGNDSGRNIKHRKRCKVCDSVFPNKQSLIEHEQTTGHFLKFGCQHCDKRFRQKIQVKRHEAQVHSEEMPFQCNRCDRKFKSEFSWKRHQDNDEIHKRLENYTPFLTCQVCGKQFERRRKWCLDQHMLTHQPSNKFPCDICGKYFRSNNYLSTHRKACAGVKEEECAFCGKRFSKKTVRLNHERLHTGELPYHCRICGSRFRTHHNYSQHGRQAHGALTASHFNVMQDEADKT